MPTQVQFRRGTTAQNNSFTGAAGELSVDTTLNVLRLHDGSTAGGHALVSGSSTITLTNKTINLSSNTLTGTIAQFNTALSDADFATLAGSETLSNKTLTTPVIAEIDNASDITLDAGGDIILDADGADVLLKDGGTTFGSLSQSGGELVIKSGSTPTTAITMSGANVTIAGNLTVSGSTTTVSSNTVSIGDSTILLNGDATGSASENAGIEVERGDDTNVLLRWNESTDTWQYTENGTDYYNVVGTSATQTLTNKTLTSPVIATISNTGTLTLPTSTDTLVGRATTDTLTNKTINIKTGQGNTFQIQDNSITSYVGTGANVVLSQSPTITSLYVPADGMYFNGTTGVTQVAASTTASGTLTLPAATDTLVGRATTDTLTNKSISLTTNTITGTTAEFNTALTDGNFATQAGTETLTNKTISVDDNTVSGVAASSFVLSNSSGYIDGSAAQKAIPTGTVVGTSDSQTLTNKTIALGSNTVTGTIAEFNTAVTDADFATLAGSETLTNKTLTSPVISTISNTGTLTLPTSTDTIVGRATTDTLTNKSISGSTNTLSNIANSSLTNSSITINGTSTALGGTRTLVTDDIAEDGSPVNLWYTDARARAAVSATDAGGDGSFSYNSSTGVFTYTGPSATEVRAHLSAGTGLTYTSGAFAIDSTVATLTGSQTLTNKTLTTPVIAEIDSAADITLDAAGDIILDADGADVLLKDGGTTFGAFTQSGGELVIKSGATPTSAITLSGADVTIAGNLTVSGTTTTVNSNTVTIGDNILVLNSDEAGTPSQNAGIEVERGTSTNASITWDESTDSWGAGLAGAEVPLVTTSGTQTLTNKTIDGSQLVAGSVANAKLTNSTISGKALGTNLDTLTMGVSGTGLSGSATYNGSGASTFTVTSNATNANTVSTIVARDASGNFSAGTITATLSGNASTASAWATGRTLSLTGDVTGTSASFDGSGNISIATTIAADSVALGTDTTGNYVASITNGSYITGGNGGSEGAGLTLAVDATSANTASKVVARDASGNFSAGTITAALSGNASTATTLATARNIQGVSFNGSADITVVTAGTGVSVSGTQVSIGQAVATSSNVTFANMTSTGVLTVSNGSTTANGIKFGADPGGGSGDIAQINYYASTGESTILHLQVDNDADDYIKLDATGGTDNVGAFRATGEITAYYSDERLKNFSGKIEGALDKVMNLNGFYYTENDLAKSFGFNNDKQQVGVSAQQVQAVLPEAVRVAPFVRDVETDTEYLTVQYEKLVPLLIEAIKEQQKKIEELEAKINKQ